MFDFGMSTAMEDDLGEGSGRGVQDPHEDGTPASHGTPRNPDRPNPCVVESCSQVRKKNNRFCSHHARLYDNMRYQAAKKGKEQLKKFLLVMKDAAVASKELQKYGAENVGAAMFKSKPLINWVPCTHESYNACQERFFTGTFVDQVCGLQPCTH